MPSYFAPYYSESERANDDGKSSPEEPSTPMTTSTSIHSPRHPFDRAPIVRTYRYTRRVLNENLYTHRTRALLWRTLWAGIQVSTILVALALSTPSLALRTPATLSVLAWLVRTLLWDRVPDHSLAVTWRPFVIVFERPEDDVRSAR
ncbi:hypothetical protein GGF50DRAFT_119191 [Schizophyllum commune]